MIQLEINGVRETSTPQSIAELQEHLRGCVPAGHVVCALSVNGLESAQDRLVDFDVASIRSIEIRTASPAELARDALGETRAWIDRICGVLESIAQDYRLGREANGADRLVSVLDALQVLVGLLSGIHDSLELDPAARARFEGPWREAEGELKLSVEGLMEDLTQGDPLRLADRTSYTLPRSLGRFREVLGQIQT